MKKLLVLAPLAVVCSLLSGCGIAAKIDSRNDMMKTRDAYTHCLETHSSNVSACNGYKAAYKANMEAYRATSAGIEPGFNNSMNLNTSRD
jgi:predicted small secreted protein